MLLHVVETVESRMTMWLYLPRYPSAGRLPGRVPPFGSLHCLSRSRHCSLARLAMVHLFTIKVARARSAVAHLHAYLEPSSCRRALSLLSRAIGGHEPSDVLEAIFRAESTRHLDGLATGIQKQGIRIAPQCGGQTADLALAAV